MVQLAIYYGSWSGADLTSLDRSTFITALGTVATLVALFCSLSVAWILFVSQQSKGERLVAYDLMKSRLLEAQRGLLSLPQTEDRETCLSLAYELDKLDLSDLPQTDRGPEYAEYCDALDSGLDSDNAERRAFYLISSTHFGYIESLLNRIGLVAIQQLVTRLFIDTLAKGVALVGLSVLVLIASLLWYDERLKPTFVVASIFIAVGSALLLVEVWVDLRRYYDDNIDFIESSETEA
ncbi:hypothetical protein [Melaminivora sp.]|uniref:hypothetical protein n=1 Tax=Melaminivora sp. TaxID=1933032 RepID=UPI0028B09671|nr:hypothetical protein [Melaminivora sp.]